MRLDELPTRLHGLLAKAQRLLVLAQIQNQLCQSELSDREVPLQLIFPVRESGPPRAVDRAPKVLLRPLVLPELSVDSTQLGPEHHHPASSEVVLRIAPLEPLRELEPIEEEVQRTGRIPTLLGKIGKPVMGRVDVIQDRSVFGRLLREMSPDGE
ncbi:MAG: hypothetical protein R3F14_42275 [Polyangiaceae bacterium]